VTIVQWHSGHLVEDSLRLMRRARFVVAAAVLLLAGGCGGGASTPAKTRTPTAAQDVAAVRAVVVGFGRASAAKDYQAICARFLGPKLVRDIEAIGLPCPGALQRALGAVRDPRLTVGVVRVRGDHASARVHSTATGQPPSDDLVELVRVRGRWYLAALAG
jgi:hypothetical protein